MFPKNVQNQMIYLERRIAFIEDKLKFYENSNGPIINTLPVKLYDIAPLNTQENRTFFSIVLIISQNDKRCPIVKVSRQIFSNLAFSNETEITIYDYLNTNQFAEKTIINNNWIWRIR